MWCMWQIWGMWTPKTWGRPPLNERINEIWLVWQALKFLNKSIKTVWPTPPHPLFVKVVHKILVFFKVMASLTKKVLKNVTSTHLFICLPRRILAMRRIYCDNKECFEVIFTATTNLLHGVRSSVIPFWGWQPQLKVGHRILQLDLEDLLPQIWSNSLEVWTCRYGTCECQRCTEPRCRRVWLDWRQGCRSRSILPSRMGARGVSLEHVENMENTEKMENMEMFSGSPTEMFSGSPTEMFSGSPT